MHGAHLLSGGDCKDAFYGISKTFPQKPEISLTRYCLFELPRERHGNSV
mgnify:CR=1 FL=1